VLRRPEGDEGAVAQVRQLRCIHGDCVFPQGS
jgi:hypothetical protein